MQLPVLVRCVRLHGEEAEADVLYSLVPESVAQHSDGVPAVRGLRDGFLVPSVEEGLEDAARPRVPCVKVHVPVLREELVVVRRVGDIPHEEEDEVIVLLPPFREVACHDGGRVEDVAVVEVMVVVVAVPEVHSGREGALRQGRADRRPPVVTVRLAFPAAVVVHAPAAHHAAPVLVVHQRVLGLPCEPQRRVVGELAQRHVAVVVHPHLVGDQHEPREPRQQLPGVVRVAGPCLVVDRHLELLAVLLDGRSDRVFVLQRNRDGGVPEEVRQLQVEDHRLCAVGSHAA
mmetsp:Transcript_17642/g.24629  ORF Transcript_17642/g.24629 Transcript_17642/m.24629 type:complete len:288 (-) Transcript_17642:1224-2087(-)